MPLAVPVRSTPGKPSRVQPDAPLLVRFTTCVRWAGVPVAAPRAKLRPLAWQVPLPAAWAGGDGDGLAGRDPARAAGLAVTAGVAARAVAEAVEELLEFAEQPATTNPAEAKATAAAVTE